jgi:hypothetical protein
LGPIVEKVLFPLRQHADKLYCKGKNLSFPMNYEEVFLT